MSENPFLSYLNNIDWSAAFQWYVNHSDAGYLIWAWEQGKAFTQDDWMSVMMLMANLLVLLSLVYLLIKKHQETLFRTSIRNRWSQLTRGPVKESQRKVEAEVTDSTFLNQAYNFHRHAMYDYALNKYKQAFQSSPYELNTYLVGIKIISEMEEPDKPFVQFLQDIIAHLRKKHPATWYEVAKYGRKKAPTLYQWQPVL